METTKICFKCNKEKPLDDYYKQKSMLDGHVGKCKECTKQDVAKNYAKNRENPDFVIKDRKRGRDKYYRLDYRITNRQTPKEKKITNKKYNAKYPEKKMAKNASQHIKVDNGLERHHWSYNKEHWKDIIPMTTPEHNKIHRYTIYDQERMMFRTTVTNSLFPDMNILLDTKEKYLEYYESLKNLE